MNIAVIGYGYWGPNLVRNFAWQETTTVKYVCDLDEKRLKQAKAQFPNIEQVVTDYQKVISDDEVEAVAISTPVHTHFSLAKEALLAGKHVLVEKPMTNNVEDAEELAQLADEKGLTLMVDHTFIFTGAVRKMKELIQAGVIGDIYYFDSIRINLGLFQHDVNVVWDLAPHDLSIMLYLIDKAPVSVSAVGMSHTDTGLENIAYMTVYYEDNTLAHFHVNWLSPLKMRQVVIGGSEKMIVYDDMSVADKVKIYDKGIDIKSPTKDEVYQSLIQYRLGDVHIPQLDGTEALKLECSYFLECITEKKKPVTDGAFGVEVVKMLSAAQVSIKQRGKIIDLK